jgi:hypothetical protein
MAENTVMDDISLIIRVIEGVPLLVLVAAFLVFSYLFRNETIF